MRIFLLIIFLILTNCTIANVVPLVIEDRNNKNIKIIEKLIEEPYQVNGKWFYPYDYKKFEEIGLAQLETSLKNGSKLKMENTIIMIHYQVLIDHCHYHQLL